MKQLVGHSEDMDTYGIYAHEIDSDKEEAARMIQKIFERILNEKRSDMM